MIVPGTIIDNRYECINQIGAGGYGNVYKAKHLLLDRVVAIKFLKTTVLDEVDGPLRFEREAKAISALQHKNIIGFHGYGIWHNMPFIVMEFVEGISLEQLLNHKLDPNRVLNIIIQVFEALDFAHRHGVVHRDLKPSNIMITGDTTSQETVKIIDFGLAKLMPGYGLPGQKLTETGFSLGTCHYMPPEQALGLVIDQRADIYAAGCIFHQTLTGMLPFDGPDNVQIMFKHIYDRIPPLARELGDSQQTTALQSFSENCMAKEPDDRYQDCCAAARDAKLLIQGKYDSLARIKPKTSNRKVRHNNRFKKILTFISAFILAAICASYILSTKTSSTQKTSKGTYTSRELVKWLNRNSDNSWHQYGVAPKLSRIFKVPEQNLPRSTDALSIASEVEAILEANEHDHMLAVSEVYNYTDLLASYYGENGQFDKAEFYSKRACTLGAIMRGTTTRSDLVGMAWTQIPQGKRAQAEETLERALAVNDQSARSQSLLPFIQAWLINLYIDDRNFMKADSMANALRPRATKIRSPEPLLALANLELAKGNYQLARRNFNEARQMNSPERVYCLLGLARTEFYVKNFRKAADYATDVVNEGENSRSADVSGFIGTAPLMLATEAAAKHNQSLVDANLQMQDENSAAAIILQPLTLLEKDLSIASSQLKRNGYDSLLPKLESAASNVRAQSIAAAKHFFAGIGD